MNRFAYWLSIFAFTMSAYVTHEFVKQDYSDPVAAGGAVFCFGIGITLSSTRD